MTLQTEKFPKKEHYSVTAPTLHSDERVTMITVVTVPTLHSDERVTMITVVPILCSHHLSHMYKLRNKAQLLHWF